MYPIYRNLSRVSRGYSWDMPVERQAERVSAPLRPVDRRFLGVLGLVGALAVAGLLVWSLTRGGDPSGTRCFTATFAASIGGSTVHYCGDEAAHYCLVNASAPEVANACRKAGFEVGST
jgi:hypothetical protein